MVPAGCSAREPVPAGPLTSPWVVSSLAEPFCSETHADLHPTHLQPLQSRPMDASAPRALPGGSWQCVFVRETYYCCHLSSPISSVCHREWVLLVFPPASYTPEAMKPTCEVQSPAEDGLACASCCHSIYSSRSLLLPMGASPQLQRTPPHPV